MLTYRDGIYYDKNDFIVMRDGSLISYEAGGDLGLITGNDGAKVTVYWAIASRVRYDMATFTLGDFLFVEVL